MTWPLHVANAIYLVSYAVKEIFWLRFVFLFASLLTVGALVHMADTPIDLLDVAGRVLRDGLRALRPARARAPARRVAADARRLAASTFRELRPRELLRLLAVGETLDHAPGERVVQQGEPLAHLAVVVDGTARVELRRIGRVELAHGAFIGELSYLTGKPPAADVIAATALRMVRWPADALRSFLAANPDTRTADAARARLRPRGEAARSARSRPFTESRFSVGFRRRTRLAVALQMRR